MYFGVTLLSNLQTDVVFTKINFDVITLVKYLHK